MADHPNYPRTRLFVEDPLATGREIATDAARAHYLLQVLRLKDGAEVALFDGVSGEWRGRLAGGKKALRIEVAERLRPHVPSPDLWLVCAPLKSGRSETVVEKATELGVLRICPVQTRFTIPGRINATRWRAIAVEAAEQSERLDVPEVAPMLPLDKALANWDGFRRLFYGDESGAGAPMPNVLAASRPGPAALLVGPEGGFAAEELAFLGGLRYAAGVGMGPRILRADTAAIAGLAMLAAWAGGWDGRPAFRGKD